MKRKNNTPTPEKAKRQHQDKQDRSQFPHHSKILERIMFYSDYVSLLRILQVCKEWNEAAQKELKTMTYFSVWELRNPFTLTQSEMSVMVEKFSKDCPSLTTIILSNTKVADEAISKLKGDKIKEMDFSNCKYFTNEGIRNLPDKLTSLNLSHTHITEAGLKYISEHLKQLKFLKLISCTRIPDEGMPHLTFKCLHHLNLTNCTNISEKGIAHLHYSCIRHLSLMNLKLEGSLEKLPSSLESLDLTNTTYADDSLKSLRQHKNLKALDLSYCVNMTCEGIAGRLPPGLKKLSLFGWKDLEDSQLRGMPEGLEELDLSYCENLTEGIFKILPFSELRLLIIRECKGIQKKKTSHRDCRIIV